MDRSGTETFSAHCTWKSSHTMSVPDGMTKEQAIEEFNKGSFDKFEDFNNGGAELTDWEATHATA